MNTGRLLVTTALEETWGDDAPVLFLGEWCRLYNRKHIWSKVDALVAQPFGVEPDQKLSNADYICELTSQILTELTDALNKYHQVQHNERYWNIILGHWLKRYVRVVFNRYYTLDQALKKYEVAGAAIFKDADYDLTTPDSMNFILACDDDKWNYAIYSRIMAFRGDIELHQVLAPLEWNDKFVCKEKRTRPLFLQASEVMAKLLIIASTYGAGIIINKSLEWLLKKIGPLFSSDTDAFIINSYLPIKEEIKLHLALGQIPRLWECPPFKQVDADPELRANLRLNYEHFDGFEKFVRYQLPEVIPVCYLEGYRDLIEAAEKMTWPKKPRFIFTSNCFDITELFKAWTALKVEHGTPYFVGQHGNNYGTVACEASRSCPERTTCDKFITWGWVEGENDIPAFVFTSAGKELQRFDASGGLLLIEKCTNNNIEHYDIYHDFTLYLEEQFLFVENLPEHIRQSLTVRLHAEYKKMRTFEDQRWKDRSPGTKIDPGLIGVRELIKQNRLVVHSYDSTGILETLAMNIPTVCFWNGGLSHLLPSAKPYFKLLEDADILFYNPESIVKFIALHWDDIAGWWESKKVQDARHAFCQQYARTVAHPARELKEILIENS